MKQCYARTDCPICYHRGDRGTPALFVIEPGDLTVSCGCRSVNRWQRVSARTAVLVDRLHSIIVELERMHPGRRFPLDGHLVGSIGEAGAEAMLELTLQPTSTTGHDAISADGRRVEIKVTYGSRSVGLRGTSHEDASALIVLQLTRAVGTDHKIVYNGALSRARGRSARTTRCPRCRRGTVVAPPLTRSPSASSRRLAPSAGRPDRRRCGSPFPCDGRRRVPCRNCLGLDAGSHGERIPSRR